MMLVSGMDENFESSEHFMRFACLWLSTYNERMNELMRTTFETGQNFKGLFIDVKCSLF